MPALLFLAAAWMMPAVVLVVLYVYEVTRRRALRREARQKAAESRARRTMPDRAHERDAVLATYALAAPAQSRGAVQHAQPVGLEVPVLLQDGTGNASMQRCTLCLN